MARIGCGCCGTWRWCFENYLARSQDLKSWQLSSANPILTPGLNDGVNASDPDILEFKGETYLYYSVGNQRTGSKVRHSVSDAPLGKCFDSYFPGGVPPKLNSCAANR